MTRPRLLDLFCGAGGAAMGYHRAGFDVVGVDIEPQPRYPFEFHQLDAMELLGRLSRREWSNCAVGAAVIHASPPCQFATKMNASHRKAGHDNHPNLLTPTLDILRTLGVPYVVENVPAAKRWMRATLLLHGGMFITLGIYRPRIFECSELILAPPEPIPAAPVGVYGQRPMAGKPWTRLNGDMKGHSLMRVATSLEQAQRVMQMPWADWAGLKEAVPPPYTHHIGLQLIDALERAV